MPRRNAGARSAKQFGVNAQCVWRSAKQFGINAQCVWRSAKQFGVNAQCVWRNAKQFGVNAQCVGTWMGTGTSVPTCPLVRILLYYKDVL